MTQRVVITGIGVVSPYGAGLDVLWDGMLSGVTAIRPFELFDARQHRTRLSGEVPAECLHLPLSGASARASALAEVQVTRADRMALSAARQAVAAAGLHARDLAERCGVFFGSSAAGMLEGERYYAALLGRSRERPRANRIVGQPTSSPAEAVARAFDVCGPIECVASACSASTMAFESALGALRSGEVDRALVGGADALCELTYGGFNSLRAVSAEACQPFRAERSGLSLGEGAAIFVLERADLARARSATILAEVAGAASSCDAHHMTAPHPEGQGAALAMQNALLDAGEPSEAVDFVCAHGTGTPHNDAAEWRALQAVFGARAERLPVCAPKASVGHLLGACGALELAVTARALLAGVLPPAPAGGVLDGNGSPDLVLGVPRIVAGMRVGLSVNLAFGGMNAAVVLRTGLVQ